MQHKHGFWLSASLIAVAGCSSHERPGSEPATSSEDHAGPPVARDSGVVAAADVGAMVPSQAKPQPAKAPSVAMREEDSGPAGNAADSGEDPANDRSETTYCDGAIKLLTLPMDPGARGPWEVGARAVKIGSMDAEVWYPARHLSSDGKEKYIYDLRKYLPEEQQGTVTDSTTIRQPCDCYRDLELDTEHGPYPVVVFAHGFSGFSGQSLPQMTHWASRGFVVLSADHPSLGLKTFLQDGIFGIAGGASSSGCDLQMANGQAGEVVQVLDALKEPSGDLAFLASHIDLTRMAASGHSAGGGAIRALSNYPDVRLLMPMASGGVCDGAELESTLVMGGLTDAIAAYTSQQDGYANAKPKKRLVGLAKAGHMAFTAFCPIGASDGGILAAAQKAGVMFDPIFLSVVGPLASDGCQAGSLPAEEGWAAINYATSAALEETLLCISDRAAQLAMLPMRFPNAVGEYQEELQ